MNIVKVISSAFDKLKRREIKFLRLGKSDVQTSNECMPFGIDSNPVKDMVAIYSQTSELGKTIIVGYINKNQLADIGETRLFSTDSNGNLQSYIWLKNDATMELMGNSDNSVRYKPLEDVVKELQNDIKTLKQDFSTWSPIPMDGGAALKAATAAWSATPLVKDIAQAKISEIKTS